MAQISLIASSNTPWVDGYVIINAARLAECFSAAAFGTSADGSIFPDDIIVSDKEISFLAPKLQILGLIANYGTGIDLVILPDDRPSFYDHPRAYLGAVSDIHIGANDAVRPDLYIITDDRVGMYNRGRMNFPANMNYFTILRCFCLTHYVSPSGVPAAGPPIPIEPHPSPQARNPTLFFQGSNHKHKLSLCCFFITDVSYTVTFPHRPAQLKHFHFQSELITGHHRPAKTSLVNTG